jgi:hypothetical protein
MPKSAGLALAAVTVLLRFGGMAQPLNRLSRAKLR